MEVDSGKLSNLKMFAPVSLKASKRSVKKKPTLWPERDWLAASLAIVASKSHGPNRFLTQ